MARKSNARRDDNRIAVQVYLGRVDGKRRYKTVYGQTQQEADDKAREVKTALCKGLDITAAYDAFGEWADLWLKIKKPEVSAARAVVYESHVKHLKSRFEFSQVARIRSADLQDLVLSLAGNNPNTKKPMARETLAGLKSTARQIFDLVVDNRVIDYNPAVNIRLPSTPAPSPRRALTREEQQWIVDTPHNARCAAMIMMYAGLRRGEMLALLWHDIDLQERTISVTKTVEFIAGKPVLKDTTKTKAGVRSVSIPQVLADYLADVPHKSIYVCVSTKNQMHTEWSWRRMWESYLADLNIRYGDFSPFEKEYKSKFDPAGVPFVIPKITPHWLRHTFATMLYFAGIDSLTAKEQLGHTDVKTTLDIYTHLDALHKKKSVSKLDAYLSAK